MDTLGFMAAGYLVVWAIAFVFVFSMWARSRRLERELEAVRLLLAEMDQEQS